MGLGMAAGLGAFAVAGLGTLFLCAMLPALNFFSEDRPRTMLVEVVASGRDLPMAHIHQVFAVNGIVFEPREVSQGDEATVRYLATLKPDRFTRGSQRAADGRWQDRNQECLLVAAEARLAARRGRLGARSSCSIRPSGAPRC